MKPSSLYSSWSFCNILRTRISFWISIVLYYSVPKCSGIRSVSHIACSCLARTRQVCLRRSWSADNEWSSKRSGVVVIGHRGLDARRSQFKTVAIVFMWNKQRHFFPCNIFVSFASFEKVLLKSLQSVIWIKSAFT